MAKFIRLSDDAVFVFLHVRRFSGAAFFHTRSYVHVCICAPAHTCATHAHLLSAREERNFSCRRFMIVLRNFSSGELQKSKIAEFSGENSAEPYKIPVKNVKFGLKRLRNGRETASCGDERAIFVRKNGKTAKTGEKKSKKKKNEKKLKNFKKRRKNS